MGALVRLDHMVIAVSDWERSNAFYRDVLGAEIVPRGAGYAYRFGEQQLNVHGPGGDPYSVAADPIRPGNSDLCFVWDGPIDGAVDLLAASGVEIEEDRSGGRAREGRGRAPTSATPTGACSS